MFIVIMLNCVAQQLQQQNILNLTAELCKKTIFTQYSSILKNQALLAKLF